MDQRLQQISFDRTKNPGIDFDLFPLDEILLRTDLNHNPLRPHRVDFYVMLFITGGVGKHTIDFQVYPYEKGSVITIRKDQIHQFHESDAKGYLLIFTEEFMVSFMDQQEADKIIKVFNELLTSQKTNLSSRQLDDLALLITQMNAEFSGDLDEHTSSIIRNLLQAFMTKLYRIRKTTTGINSDHKYMHRFLLLQELVEFECTRHRNVSHFADQLNVTTRTLNNITHAIIKKSAKTFINEVLLLQIKRQLINTNRTIKEIAYSSGFDEPTNFFKFFRKSTQLTPEQFRAQHGKVK